MISGLLALAGTLVPILTGVGIVRLLYSGRGHVPVSRGLMLSLGALVGPGLVSILYFAVLSAGLPLASIVALEAGLMFGVLAMVYQHHRRGPGPARSDDHGTQYAGPTPPAHGGAGGASPPQADAGPSLTRTIERWAVPAALVIAVVTFWVRTALHPHGGFDVWATWNLHARFIYRAPENWSAYMTGDLAWSHPDYPLMWPLLTAHGWTFSGGETMLAPAFMSFAFFMATLGLVYFGLRDWARVAGPWRTDAGREPGEAGRHETVEGDRHEAAFGRPAAARLALLMLIGTPFLAIHAADKYADVPLAALFLASIVLLVRYGVTGDRRDLALGGLVAGLAAWTKNEGALMLVAVVCGALVALPVPPRPGGRRVPIITAATNAAWIVIGAALPLAALLIFKLTCPIPSDLVVGQTGELLTGRITNPARYLTILKAFLVEAQAFGRSPVSYYVLAGWFVVSRWTWPPRMRPAPASPLAAAWICLGLVLAGYFAVYLLTPHDLAWHVEHSLNRLLLQIWPAAVYVVVTAGSR